MHRPLLLASLALIAACDGHDPDLERPAPVDLETHSIVFMGELFLGRRVNLALHDEASRDLLFAGVGDLIRRADLALANAEGVISGGGRISDKGEWRPYHYRVHPNAAQVLADAGFDLLMSGNNHAADYGADAFREHLDRVQLAGMSYAGAGYDRDDAMQPAYFTVGDTVVAVVGADLAFGERGAATSSSPGPLWMPGLKEKKQDRVVSELLEIEEEAREFAHVVLLSPHWGRPEKTEPSEHTRQLARRLIRGGYDGILGHSARVVQGVELVDGKPVIYDAGTGLVDYTGGGPTNRAMLYELDFTQAGVSEVRAWPIELKQGETRRGGQRRAQIVTQEWKERSEALGTTVSLADPRQPPRPEGAAALDPRRVNPIGVVRCDPGGVRGPLAAGTHPTRERPKAVREAPADIYLDALPADATAADVDFGGGLHLVGYRLWLDEVRAPKGANLLDTYWRLDAPSDVRYSVVTELQPVDPAADMKPQLDQHVPGDWLAPSHLWPAGAIVRDRVLLRAVGAAGVEHQVTLAVFGDAMRGPINTTLPVVGGKLLVGSATFSDTAPRVVSALEKLGFGATD